MAKLLSQEHIIQRIRDAENPLDRHCFDCDENAAPWCSTSFGVILCLKCAGHHRGLGTHISFVQSLTLDTWKEKVCALMSVGGNARARQWFAEHREELDQAGDDLRSRYCCPMATKYREMLWDEAMVVMGKDPKEERRLIAQEQAKYAALAAARSSSSSSMSSSSSGGFGNYQPTKSNQDSHDDSNKCCIIL